ncbi:MAG: histidine triad nucleotide-binding protein [Clostridiales bacterium]|nr:histidine triad nucleotide-binding protein [Clostridiales bacterium]
MGLDCVFCKIAKGEIPSKKAYEDDSVLAFYDLDPKAPVHILIIPKRHIESVMEITPENSGIVAHLFEVAAKLARENNLTEGFRLVANTGKDGGQTVPHLHLHLLGGRSMKWPPG